MSDEKSFDEQLMEALSSSDFIFWSYNPTPSILLIYANRSATLAERLQCSPPIKAIRVQSPAGSLRIFACGNRAGRCRWSAGYIGGLPFPPPFRYGAAPYSYQSPSSALKTSMLRAVQISSLPGIERGAPRWEESSLTSTQSWTLNILKTFKFYSLRSPATHKFYLKVSNSVSDLLELKSECKEICCSVAKHRRCLSELLLLQGLWIHSGMCHWRSFQTNNTHVSLYQIKLSLTVIFAKNYCVLKAGLVLRFHAWAALAKWPLRSLRVFDEYTKYGTYKNVSSAMNRSLFGSNTHIILATWLQTQINRRFKVMKGCGLEVKIVGGRTHSPISKMPQNMAVGRLECRSINSSELGRPTPLSHNEYNHSTAGIYTVKMTQVIVKRGMSKELSSNHTSRRKEQVFGVYLRGILVATLIGKADLHMKQILALYSSGLLSVTCNTSTLSVTVSSTCDFAKEASNEAIPLCRSTLSVTVSSTCDFAKEASNEAIPLCRSTLSVTVSSTCDFAKEASNEAIPLCVGGGGIIRKLTAFCDVNKISHRRSRPRLPNDGAVLSIEALRLCSKEADSFHTSSFQPRSQPNVLNKENINSNTAMEMKNEVERGENARDGETLKHTEKTCRQTTRPPRSKQCENSEGVPSSKRTIVLDQGRGRGIGKKVVRDEAAKRQAQTKLSGADLRTVTVTPFKMADGNKMVNSNNMQQENARKAHAAIGQQRDAKLTRDRTMTTNHLLMDRCCVDAAIGQQRDAKLTRDRTMTTNHLLMDRCCVDAATACCNRATACCQTYKRQDDDNKPLTNGPLLRRCCNSMLQQRDAKLTRDRTMITNHLLMDRCCVDAAIGQQRDAKRTRDRTMTTDHLLMDRYAAIGQQRDAKLTRDRTMTTNHLLMDRCCVDAAIGQQRDAKLTRDRTMTTNHLLMDRCCVDAATACCNRATACCQTYKRQDDDNKPLTNGPLLRRCCNSMLQQRDAKLTRDRTMITNHLLMDRCCVDAAIGQQRDAKRTRDRTMTTDHLLMDRCCVDAATAVDGFGSLTAKSVGLRIAGFGRRHFITSEFAILDVIETDP
ncbi:hypothetical protein PR048_014148 [Dryococelus australis]|uniref:Uncharacterized protein n=1 Tax=Dryococelus australis TaxID=614101 RepID=A0ABQ9HDE5_9NEOP|nr:hypothetical protein PR048_014148 [Dryococelus australis]